MIELLVWVAVLSIVIILIWWILTASAAAGPGEKDHHDRPGGHGRDHRDQAAAQHCAGQGPPMRMRRGDAPDRRHQPQGQKKGLAVIGAEWGSAASGGTEPSPEVRMSDVSIPEDAAIGDLVGLLSVQNPSGSYTFTMTSSAGGKFALDGVDDTRVEVAGALDYETATSHSITIEADNGVDPISQIFNIRSPTSSRRQRKSC